MAAFRLGLSFQGEGRAIGKRRKKEFHHCSKSCLISTSAQLSAVAMGIGGRGEGREGGEGLNNFSRYFLVHDAPPPNDFWDYGTELN
ncbi:hypothetical protein CEXT_283571 [Caerostris extrusa]|uniref:Uncharacterized protein n=1 Tax=Caerostris extrusa TaxID=172846 RepID=A0AAV4WT73_CAEEX|nr:hypothetical protein CEXT_283571 [Caerostris extrusa]